MKENMTMSMNPLVNFLKKSPKEFTKADIMKYVEEKDPEILNDMHSGNYGYRPNGIPCILDFASFNS